MNVSKLEFYFQKKYLGDYNDDLNFEYGDGTDLHNGCSATLLGEFWYFGGGGSTNNPYIRQVDAFFRLYGISYTSNLINQFLDEQNRRL